MYTVTFIIFLIVILAAMGAVYTAFKPRINFFITGLDSGFAFTEISMLWTAAELCNLEQPTALFYSLPALTKCMTQIANTTAVDNNPKNQLLMTKLFNYRTKIQNEADDKKGMTTTHSLDKGQTLRIILPGKGVFASEIVGNGNFLVINVPRQNNLIPFSGEDWVGKIVSVYLWRKGDARYVFDTTVTQSGLFLGKSALFLKHSSNLVRTQKRKSVRLKCQIYGMLYIVKKDKVDINAIETQNGFRCLIEDISESGALIRIGGKGVQNVKIKLQFNIQNKLILMVGIVRTVEFNEEQNQSLLHFECTHIEPSMRNEILRFVYNMMPQNEKEVLEALEQTEGDEKASLNSEKSLSEDLAAAQTEQTDSVSVNQAGQSNPAGQAGLGTDKNPDYKSANAAGAPGNNTADSSLGQEAGDVKNPAPVSSSIVEEDSSKDIANKADEINVF